MKTIRQGTFETNSSSCHSITFNNYGDINLEGIDKLEARASGEYCGSDNYVRDDDGYSYDAGAPLPDPQSKFDYAMVCYIEYLNRRALFEDKLAWYNTNKIKDFIGFPRWKVPLPVDVYECLYDDYTETKENLISSFNNKGVKIDWLIPEPNSLEHINSGKSCTGELLVKEFVDIDGYIDHDSSCSQHEPGAWMLAEMCHKPDELFDFVFRDTNRVIIQYAG